jgi:hypothetical protein
MKFYTHLFLLLLSGNALAQSDTNYIQSYYNNVIPRGLYNYKNQEINLYDTVGDSTLEYDSFSTGNQHFMGGDVSYKWGTLGYNFSLSPKKSNHNLDFRFSTAYKPFQLQAFITRLQNLTYTFTVDSLYGVKIDTLISSREQNIKLLNIGTKLEYVFNHKKYCYSAGFSQGGRQLKSAGSFIASGGLFYDNFSLKKLSKKVKYKFDNVNGFNEVEFLRLDVGVGYGYNWVLFKNWTIAFTEIPNIGFQSIYTGLNDKKVNKYFIISFTNQSKGGILYTNNRFFVGASAYNSLTVVKLENNLYSNLYTTVNIYTGWIFGKLYKKRS